MKVFKDLIDISYWPIYGEIRTLDDWDKCYDDVENCKNFKEVNASYALLMIYMVIASVLLINLLIAMFRLASTHMCAETSSQTQN